MISEFHKKVIKVERKKLAAVQDKLPAAIAAQNWGRVASLAECAERIASRFLIILDNTRE